jgi:integrase/recombinase XerD
MSAEIVPAGMDVPQTRHAQRFEAQIATPFINKSVSEETRGAYRTAVAEFFAFVNGIAPERVAPAHVAGWRDRLRAEKKKASTVAFKLSVIRSLFAYLEAQGIVKANPASTKLVSVPKQNEDLAGRSLTSREVMHLLSGPDQSTSEGARDYALMFTMLRTGLRVSEVASLKQSDVKWNLGRWVVNVTVKGGRVRTLPLPAEVRKSMRDYVAIDGKRRELSHTDGADSFIFQPHSNYRTLEFDKPLSRRMILNIVTKWGSFTGVGKLSPHDLRRTAITKALDQGLTYRQVQMMSGHKDPKTVMKYDHGRKNLEQNAVNFIEYSAAGD